MAFVLGFNFDITIKYTQEYSKT